MSELEKASRNRRLSNLNRKTSNVLLACYEKWIDESLIRYPDQTPPPSSRKEIYSGKVGG
jgi:hypothetical protein